MSNEPWIVNDDFNEVNEVGGSDLLIGAILDIQLAFADCSLMDLRFVGLMETWHNKQYFDNYIQECLDMFVGDEAWFNLFPSA